MEKHIKSTQTQHAHRHIFLFHTHMQTQCLYLSPVTAKSVRSCDDGDGEQSVLTVTVTLLHPATATSEEKGCASKMQPVSSPLHQHSQDFVKRAGIPAVQLPHRGQKYKIRLMFLKKYFFDLLKIWGFEVCFTISLKLF